MYLVITTELTWAWATNGSLSPTLLVVVLGVGLFSCTILFASLHAWKAYAKGKAEASVGRTRATGLHDALSLASGPAVMILVVLAILAAEATNLVAFVLWGTTAVLFIGIAFEGLMKI